MAQLWQHGIVEQSLGESYVLFLALQGRCGGRLCLGRLAEHAFESGHGLARPSSIPSAEHVLAPTRRGLRPIACYFGPRFGELPEGGGRANSSGTI